MRIKTLFLALLSVAILAPVVPAQRGDVVVTLDEAFFESLLDAVFKDGGTLTFPMAGVPSGPGDSAAGSGGPHLSSDCDESVRLHREIKGQRTAVTLRDGRIFAPVAFTGAYAPPLFGCLDYSGVAETEISLEFDPTTQSLSGRAKVVNVKVSGTGGVGGTLIARFVQSSIDEKLNPMRILGLDRLSFGVPVPGANVNLRAVGIDHRIGGGVLVVRLTYEFVRS